MLGHALYMKAIHGGKAKNDRTDALKIATLLRGGLLPQAYVWTYLGNFTAHLRTFEGEGESSLLIVRRAV